MKSTTVSALTAIVTIAMCIMPLLNSDLSEAAVLTPGDRAADFDAGGIGDEDFNGLFTESYKAQIAFRTLEAMDADVSHTAGPDVVYDYEITEDIYSRLGTFGDDVDNERLIKTGKMAYSFENTIYGTLGPERTVWDEEANKTMNEAVRKQENNNKGETK